MSWIILATLAVGYYPTGVQTAAYPWSPGISCNLNPAKPAGLHPEALAALKGLALGHRITQGINHAVERGNVHGSDGLIKGNPYTAAADISVRCLSDAQIRTLLDRLADVGFAAWYRKDGQDGWKGPPHVHAVFAGCRLKPVLHLQIEDWLGGGTGLSRNEPYRFWQPSQPAREKLRERYRPFFPTPVAR
jgi:hypothetical protein